MPAKKTTKRTTKKAKTGGGAKSKSDKAKAESRKKAVSKKTTKTAHKGKSAVSAVKRTRTKAARQKSKKIDIEPVLTAEDIEMQEYSTEEFELMLSMYEGTLRDIKEGEVVKGTVLGVTKDDVIVDVGFKSEGIIPISEFPTPVNVKVGDEIDVYLDAIENSDGQLVLSKQKADFMRVWDEIKESHDSGETVVGKVVRRIKGGMVIDMLGVDAFLPGSQIALRQVPDFDALLGQSLELKIIKINKSRRNIVVSRRVVLEVEREKMRDHLLQEIEPGQVRKGIIKNITDFGVFIDLGGVDGLLHITDMSWGRINHPSELVHLQEEIDVKVLDFDKSNGRISLGLKQLTPYPWEKVDEKFPVGSRITGRIVSITDYGAFMELEKGIEGLVHISEMSWTQHIKHPSKLLNVNDTIEAVVLSVDKENEKISLGLKQLEPDPWEMLDLKYPAGTKVSGKVRNLTTFGAFVEIEDGIDGLVHISDMSWTKRIQHPSEIMNRGDEVGVVILGIDKDNRRISLGHKQVQPDPWPELQKQFSVGTETMGNASRLLDRGIIVDLPGGVEGFVPTNQLGKQDISRPAEAFTEGDELPLKVIEFDSHNRRIILSVDAYLTGREETEVEAYLAKHPTKVVPVADLVEDSEALISVETPKPAAKEDKAVEEPAEAPEEVAPVEESKEESPDESPDTEQAAAETVEEEDKTDTPPAED
ncbi:MAG: 30S ribosomal protein S1 [candidate division Zixibacteria bacterium]